MKIKESRKMLFQSLGVAAILIAALTACGTIAEPTPTPLPTIDPDTPGDIHGVLQDSTGAPVPDVTVMVVQRDPTSGGVTRYTYFSWWGEAITDSTGAFVLENVPPGVYHLANSLEFGFNVLTSSFELEPNEVLDLGVIQYKE